METIRRAVLVLSLALGAPLSQAADVAPDTLLSAATSELIAVLKQNRDRAESPGRLAELIQTKVLPLFDFFRMTQLAMARNWRLASLEQQSALTAEFTTLLIRTYSVALFRYRDQTVEFKPLHAAPGDARATVKAMLVQGGERMAIDYDMHRTPAGWKIFDVKFDGTSLIATYRHSFAARVRDTGVDGLIAALAEKNRMDDSAAMPPGLAEERARFLDGMVRSVLRAGG